MNGFGADNMSSVEMEALMREVDADGSGDVLFPEFVKMMALADGGLQACNKRVVSRPKTPEASEMTKEQRDEMLKVGSLLMNHMACTR